MTDAVFVVGSDGGLTAAPRTAFALETDLQQLIAKYPELLPGDQIDPESPRRWRLIRREATVGSATSPSRWSLDHLFVDQDATPTLVEAKRGGNPEARRQVVAQLIEYAANASLYWPIDQLRSWFEEGAGSADAAAESFAELTGSDPTDTAAYEEFWQRFDTNLRNRNMRLIFVADAIPTELRTLVEFLNEQMSGVDVLAVEIGQYRDANGSQLLRPQLIGQTAKARAKGPVTTTKRLQSLDDFLGLTSGSVRDRAQAVLDAWTGLPRASIGFGAAKSVRLLLSDPSKNSAAVSVFSLEASGDVWFNRGAVLRSPAFADTDAISQLDSEMHGRLGSVTVGAKGYFVRLAQGEPSDIAALGAWIDERLQRLASAGRTI